MLHHTLISRCFATSMATGGKGDGGAKPRMGRDGSMGGNAMMMGMAAMGGGGGGGGGGGAKPAFKRGGSGRNVGGGGDDLSALEGNMLQLLQSDLDEAVQQLLLSLAEPHATVLGANTAADDEWGTPERFLHASLALLFQLVLGRPELTLRLSSDGWLRTLATVLHVGSLRCCRLLLRTLKHVLPLRSPLRLSIDLFAPPEASSVAPVSLQSMPLTEESAVDLAEDSAGAGAAGSAAARPTASQRGSVGVGGAAPPALDGGGVGGGGGSGGGSMGGDGDGDGAVLGFLLMLLADQVAGEISGEHYTLFSSGSLWRNAQVGSAMASETVSLLRALMQCEGWSAPLHATLTHALLQVPEVVRLLQADPTAAQLTEAALLPAAFQALGAFSVLGGNLPSLFVGCRVSVEVEGAQGQTTREQGILVRWDGAEDSDALMLLDTQLSELRLLAMSTLQVLLPLPSGASAPPFRCLCPLSPRHVDARRCCRSTSWRCRPTRSASRPS